MNILMKIWNSFRPSMRAASIVSFGKVRALLRKYMMRNGVARLGRKKPTQLLSRPALENIWNSGTSTATNGTIIASIRMLITRSLYLS